MGHELDDGTKSLLSKVATTVRQIKTDESYDEAGERLVWHQGSAGTELLTWEHEERGIIAHELSFMGQVIEVREDTPLRTGALPMEVSVSHAGMMKTETIEMHKTPDIELLKQATFFLHASGVHDSYIDDLMARIDAAIAG